MTQKPGPDACLTFADAERTEEFGRWVAPQLRAGDVLLLDGPLGAGKTHLARAIIQARLDAEGRHEDVPSPTFTLVQHYDGAVPLLHADLYRLGDASEAAELGLYEGFATSIALIEWPAKLGSLMPRDALTLRIEAGQSWAGRTVRLSALSPRWAPLIGSAAGTFGT
jgi:tRNA threonylcarbamoyl adenosine modification protein YjeE